MRKGLWSPDEDERLLLAIRKYVNGSWSDIARKAGLDRCGKSCRRRWMNHLRPDLKHGGFSPEEIRRILRLHRKLGNRWSDIAKHLDGRTDNDIKNLWNTKLKKSRPPPDVDDLAAHADGAAASICVTHIHGSRTDGPVPPSLCHPSDIRTPPSASRCNPESGDTATVAGGTFIVHPASSTYDALVAAAAANAGSPRRPSIPYCDDHQLLHGIDAFRYRYLASATFPPAAANRDVDLFADAAFVTTPTFMLPTSSSSSSSSSTTMDRCSGTSYVDDIVAFMESLAAGADGGGRSVSIPKEEEENEPPLRHLVGTTAAGAIYNGDQQLLGVNVDGNVTVPGAAAASGNPMFAVCDASSVPGAAAVYGNPTLAVCDASSVPGAAATAIKNDYHMYPDDDDEDGTTTPIMNICSSPSLTSNYYYYYHYAAANMMNAQNTAATSIPDTAGFWSYGPAPSSTSNHHNCAIVTAAAGPGGGGYGIKSGGGRNDRNTGTTTSVKVERGANMERQSEYYVVEAAEDMINAAAGVPHHLETDDADGGSISMLMRPHPHHHRRYVRQLGDGLDGEAALTPATAPAAHGMIFRHTFGGTPI